MAACPEDAHAMDMSRKPSLYLRLARTAGIEPARAALETAVLPLNYVPMKLAAARQAFLRAAPGGGPGALAGGLPDGRGSAGERAITPAGPACAPRHHESRVRQAGREAKGLRELAREHPRRRQPGQRIVACS